MKKTKAFITTALMLTWLLPITLKAEILQPVDPPDWWKDSMVNLDQRMKWWEDSRFGLFMHWGAYSVLGGEYNGQKQIGAYAEHIVSKCKIPKKDYIEQAAGKFRPEKFDADEWVRLAKNAGMKFIVITAKHHDGFCIYDSKFTDFDVKDTAHWDRDPLKELSAACKKYGLHFGVYYSHAQDWYDPDNVVNNWDYDNPTKSDWYKEDSPYAALHKQMMNNYLDRKAIPQIKELIDGYGVEMFWFDTSNWMPLDLRLKVLKATREAKPDVIVNQRVAGGDGGNFGDYTCGPDIPIVFPEHKERYWEAIQSTTAHSWGYNKFDQENHRSPAHLLRMLVTVVSKGGTMMMNIGPKSDGTFTQADVDILKYFADWMELNAESVHGAKKSPLPAQDWGVVTAKDNQLYLHVFNWPENGELRLGGLKNNIQSAVLTKGNVSLATQKDSNGVLVIKVPKQSSHPDDSVIKIVCDGRPEGDGFRLLDPDRQNRLHFYDCAILQGDDLSFTGGKGEDAYIRGWKNPADKILLNVRNVRACKYDVQLIYDVPVKKQVNNSYQIKMGDKVLAGNVNAPGTGDKGLVDAEIKLMCIDKKMATQIVADDLGELDLGTGTYTIELSAKDKIKGQELFRPRALILKPRSPAPESNSQPQKE